MTPSSRFSRPQTYDELVDVFRAEGEDAVAVAGGQSLVIMLRLGLVHPAVLVHLGHLPDASTVRVDRDDGHVELMSMTTARQVERDAVLAAHIPLVAEAASVVATPAVRNLGTLVGNACQADPGSDVLPALLASDASITALSHRGDRRIGMDAWLLGPYENALDDDEVAISVSVPIWPDLTWGYRKLTLRSGDHPVATAAVALDLQDGLVTRARCVVGGVGPVPNRLPEVEDALVGSDLPSARQLARGLDLGGVLDAGDGEFPATYRTHAASVLMRRALGDALERQGH